MHGRMRSPLAMIALGAWACAAPAASAEADLERALALGRGDGARVGVGFLRDASHLLVLADDPELLALPDADVQAQAAALATAVSTQYQRAEALDSLTVRLVQFLPGAGASWCGYYSVTYAVHAETGMFPPPLHAVATDTLMGRAACRQVVGPTARAPAP